MTRVTISLVAAAGLVAVTACAPARGDWVYQWREATPQCRDHPDAPVIGRAAGMVGFEPTRSASFVGCFPSMDACYAWLGPLSGRFGGRIFITRCDPRT
ncbi:hypothetical protein [Acuticoccus sp. I52.16.1]|uniref:hypothetical protein n=1 Tax=Acuticoccus sp. I52.16.1 TaxID=2928472 RepID=UPI001FD0E40F|nr:hypothetical protein [Acuticoccus sp. I52.16.1]UOM34339.1 hypothetical protein MRB58_21335 [Acuticoccus sp. I52.16.1]